MYISELRLWNFRKFGCGKNNLDLDKPDLEIPFNQGINVLIGENDSGKTGIVDAIKIVLKTHSADWIRLDHEDFFEDSLRLRIEIVFRGLSSQEAGHFTEWLGWTSTDGTNEPFLRVILDATRNLERVLPFDIKGGIDEYGVSITAEAKEYLKATYLRPLRNAKSELVPRKNSRLSQILAGHEAFKGKENNHLLVDRVIELNEQIKNYFDGIDREGNSLNTADLKGRELKEEIDMYLQAFAQKTSQFEVTGGNLKSILESLMLVFENDVNLGLGSHNLLFISSELLHLNKEDWTGIRLGLIEEIEAHLHPQVQLQVIEKLQEQKGIQLIFTTHSPNIASKLSLDKLLLCHGNNAFSMGKSLTKLEDTDYTFLERFLSVTKANLFFAKGVILVEGWGEELFLPSLAKKVDINLTQKGVSIVNVGSTAFLRYSRIFLRQSETDLLELPVAIITDVDIKPDKYKEVDPEANTEIDFDVPSKILEKETKYTDQYVKGFVAPKWTLEYCLSYSLLLRKIFFKAVLKAWKEKKMDKGVVDMTSINTLLDNIDNQFNNWNDSQEDIAFEIYHSYMFKKKISKSIVSQHFAIELEVSDISKEELEADQSIKYLIDSIKYASRN